MNWLSSRLRYSNVMSTIAVFVALGGASYAAVTLPKNSVGTKQIKNNAVTSPKVKDHSLLAKDFKAGQLPKGATGATGPQGPQGPKGDTGLQGPKGDIGPSTAFHFDSGTGVLDWNGASQVVATLNLPAGSYLVFAKVLANNNDSSDKLVRCQMTLGGSTLDDGFDGVTVAAASPGDRLYIPLSGTKTITAAGTVSVSCTAGGSSAGNYLNRHIEAIQVGSLG